MPLKIKDAAKFAAGPGETRWEMLDVSDRRPVAVSVSSDALADLSPGGASLESHGHTLLSIASDKYDRRQLEPDGSVRIVSADLARPPS